MIETDEIKTESSSAAPEMGSAADRLHELDLLKAVAVVGMILCHAVYMLGAHHENYEQDLAYFVADYVFGSYLAVAHAFMFSMGVGIVFSPKNRPSNLVKRGVFLYVAGYVLNFFRYGIYALADGLIEGQFLEETVYAFIVQDIFHFAGLALIFVGLCRAIRWKEWHICLAGAVFSVFGALLAFSFDKNPVLNFLLGHFFI